MERGDPHENDSVVPFYFRKATHSLQFTKAHLKGQGENISLLPTQTEQAPSLNSHLHWL